MPIPLPPAIRYCLDLDHATVTFTAILLAPTTLTGPLERHTIHQTYQLGHVPTQTQLSEVATAYTHFQTKTRAHLDTINHKLKTETSQALDEIISAYRQGKTIPQTTPGHPGPVLRADQSVSFIRHYAQLWHDGPYQFVQQTRRI